MVIVMDHRDVTFNDLYKLDLDLFKKISEEITSVAKYSEKYKKQSYTIVFERIEEEVLSLLGEEDEHKMKEFLDDNKIKYEYADIKCY